MVGVGHGRAQAHFRVSASAAAHGAGRRSGVAVRNHPERGREDAEGASGRRRALRRLRLGLLQLTALSEKSRSPVREEHASA